MKPFIDVDKEQTAPLFCSNSELFICGSAKILFASRAHGTLATPMIAVD